jgi:beta-mannosidase
VELDLLAAGLVEEPFVGMNIVGLRDLEEQHLTYGTVFTVDRAQDPELEPELLFEGIDCDAAVYLNGVLVHESRNMLVEQRVAVDGVLRYGSENTLCVAIRPVLARARSAGLEYPAGLVAEGSGFEGLYVRKAPHMFGWDIMPRAVSGGIWRPVTLRFLPRRRLDWAWLETELIRPGGSAQLSLHVRARTHGPGRRMELRVEGRCGDSRFEVRRPLLFDAAVVPIVVAEPKLWWPRGRGEPDLYDVRVTLLDGGLPIDSLAFRHGIRTVELDRTSVTSDAGDGEFRFIVNGEPVFILGTNWVPLDAFHSRDAERMPAVLAAVDEIGCNMIRCWGGNVYESDAFFDRCDELGILVWQDFAMACAIYPQDPAFSEELRREAVAVVRRLRQHPSLVLWAGDNECDQKHVRTGPGRDPNHNVLTRQVLPAVLRDEDPSRPYLPSSPYMDPAAVAAGERYLPEDHLWGPRDDFKGPYYREALAHFASEIGYLGAPAVDSLRRFLTPDRLWPYQDNPEWLLHSTSPFPGVNVHDYRVELLAIQVRSLFGTVPASLGDFVLASQAAQAEAFKFFIEQFRAGKWRRTGIIWWNIADGWPQLSDAIIDYYGVRKLAFEVVRRSQQPVCVVLREPAGGRHDVVVCNDGRQPCTVDFRIRDLDTGAEVAAGSTTVPGDTAVAVGSVDEMPDAQRFLAIEWSADGDSGRSHYLAGRPPFALGDYARWIRDWGLGTVAHAE